MTHTADQYRIIAGGAGWTDRTERGQLVAAGRDAATFLHALLTNDIASLQPGQGTYACYLTPQGRLIADMGVYHLGESLLLDVPAAVAASLATKFDSLVFAEDVTLVDRSSSHVTIALLGSQAADAAAAILDSSSATLSALPLRSHITANGVTVARTDDPQPGSFDVFLSRADYDRVRDRLTSAGASLLEADVAEAARIEAGRPVFGVDMTDETIPLEAGLLDRAISLGKGCYVGQEVIVRVLHRGQGRVAKKLMRLTGAEGVKSSPVASETLSFEGRDVGKITSAAWSVPLNRRVALGYVHRDVAESGRVLMAGETQVEIVGLAG